MISRKHENILRIIALDKFDILVNRICGAPIPVGVRMTLVGWEDLYSAEGPVKVPRQSVSDVIIKDKRLILGKHSNGIESGIHTV